MALPKSFETKKNLALRKIVEATNEGAILGWPKPTPDDFRTFGEMMWLYSSIDFVLIATATVMDINGMLGPPYKGKIQNYGMQKINEGLLSSKIWSGRNRGALERIQEIRGLRNLIAHFVVKRFPNDDAFLFITNSAYDFEQVYGVKPAPGHVLYGILESQVVAGVLPEIGHLLQWAKDLPLSIATPVQQGGS